MKTWSAIVVAVAFSVVASSASAQTESDCIKAAEKDAAGKGYGSVFYVNAAKAWIPLTQVATGAPGRTAVYSVSADDASFRQLALEPDEEYQKPHVVDGSCVKLRLQVFVAGKPTSPPPASQPAPQSLVRTSFAPSAILGSERGALVAGESHGALVGATTETLQILGQIVVDRATEQGYRLIQKRLTKLLGCGENARLPATCAVVTGLRIQDVAASRTALYGALVSDCVGLIEGKLPASDGGMLRRVLRGVIQPALMRPADLLTAASAETILRELTAVAVSEIKDTTCPNGPAKQALALATLALLSCEADVGAGRFNASLASCPVAARVDRVAEAWSCAETKDLTIRSYARQLATHFQVALVGGTSSSPNPRLRLSHAVDAVFEYACLEASGNNTCDGAEQLRRAHELVSAAVAADANSFVVATIALLRSELADKLGDKPKGLRLLAGLLQYAETYATGETDLVSKHEQRTRILESLTREMTDRSGREGDGIWSFGGSLRLVGAFRFDVDGQKAFWGPLSLPLGISFEKLSSDDGAMLHLDVSPVDLGAYISYEDGGEVREPELADVLMPSLSVGIGWGADMPVVLSATVSYAPSFDFDHNNPNDGKGAFTVGVAFGIYVPLIDIN